MNQTKILLIDDDTSLLKLLSIRLTAAGFIVETACSGRQALGKLPLFQPHLIITDLRMEEMDGLALFEAVHARYPSLPVIILTAHGTIPDAVDATRKGVFSYLTKPFDSKELLDNINAAQRHSYPQMYTGTVSTDQTWRHQIVSTSAVMDELLKQAWRVAQADVSTLIQSESGTGKELLAQAIHTASPRAAGPFVAINCAAIPKALLESELFGHRKGAFTGADRNHIGLFETANGGTLFLDEIGDMPLEFQAKLLRVLQESEVRPVGMTQAVALDVRVVSATHTDLESAIEARTFREDLYYRLNTVILELPALTDRCEDIPLLANHCLTQLKQRASNCIAQSFSRESMELLMTAPWPGNIRQLFNVVEQVAVLTTSAVISSSLVQKALRGKTKKLLPLGEAQSQFERDYLIQMLQMTCGNVCQAAKLAQRNRTDFYKLLHRHQLKPALFRHS